MYQVKWLKKMWRWIFISFAIVAILLGTVGFMGCEFGRPYLTDTLNFCDSDKQDFFRALISTLQLFVLNVPHDQIKNSFTLTAAYLAPISTVGAALLTFGSNISHWFVESVLLSIKPADYVFIGGGESASGIATKLNQNPNKKPKIIGLDINENSPLQHAIHFEKINGFMRHGDALNDEGLNCLLLNKSKNIWINTGNDLLNLEVSRRVLKIINQSKSITPINLYVHAKDHHFTRTQQVLFSNIDTSKVNLEIFSLSKIAARAVINQFPPCIKPNEVVPHVLILGCSELAISILLHTIQHCVFDDMAVVKVTWAGLDVTEKLEKLKQKYIGLAATSQNEALAKLLPLVELNTIDCDEDELSPVCWQLAQDKAKQSFDIAYIATENDDTTLTAALRVATLRELTERIPFPIIACLQQSQGSLSKVIKSNQNSNELQLEKNTTANQLFAINIYDVLIDTKDTYPSESKDVRAMIINAVYNGVIDLDAIDINNPTIDVNEIKKQWQIDRKSIFNQQSSRLSADHIDIKLQILERLEIKPNELKHHRKVLDKLAKIEHARFIAERIIDGWLPLPISSLENGASGLNKLQQKNYLLTNHTLVPYNELPKIDKQIDQQKVDADIVNALSVIPFIESKIQL